MVQKLNKVAEYHDFDERLAIHQNFAYNLILPIKVLQYDLENVEMRNQSTV